MREEDREHRDDGWECVGHESGKRGVDPGEAPKVGGSVGSEEEANRKGAKRTLASEATKGRASSREHDDDGAEDKCGEQMAPDE